MIPLLVHSQVIPFHQKNQTDLGSGDNFVSYSPQGLKELCDRLVIDTVTKLTVYDTMMNETIDVSEIMSNLTPLMTGPEFTIILYRRIWIEYTYGLLTLSVAHRDMGRTGISRYTFVGMGFENPAVFDAAKLSTDECIEWARRLYRLASLPVEKIACRTGIELSVVNQIIKDNSPQQC